MKFQMNLFMRIVEQIPVKCLIVDDEPMARDIIRRYIEKLPSLQLVGECGNAIDAMVFLQKESTDLIFLDIRMPHLSKGKSLLVASVELFTYMEKRVISC